MSAADECAAGGAPIAISLQVTESELADRLAELLGGVSGLRLVGADEPADVMLISPGREPVAEAGLTPRERQVLALLAEGLSNKTIARRLGISAHTIPAGHSCRAAAR